MPKKKSISIALILFWVILWFSCTEKSPTGTDDDNQIQNFIDDIINISVENNSGSIIVKDIAEDIVFSDSIKKFFTPVKTYEITFFGDSSQTKDTVFCDFEFSDLRNRDENTTPIAFIESPTGEKHIFASEIDRNQNGKISQNFSVILSSSQRAGSTIKIVIGPLELIEDLSYSKINMEITELGNSASENVLVFVHGLFRGSDIWESSGLTNTYKDYRILLVDYFYLCHISSNGGNLKDALSTTEYLLSDNIKKITFIAHSMGGLVARKCLCEAESSNLEWINKVDKLILFSSPSDGGKFYLLDPLASNEYSMRWDLWDTFKKKPMLHGVFDLIWGYMNKDWYLVTFPYSINHKTSVHLPDNIKVHAMVHSKDGFVSIKSAFDKKRAPFDLNLNNEVDYVNDPGTMANENAVVINGKNERIFDKVRLVWDNIEKVYKYAEEAVTGIISDIQEGYNAHGSYKEPEGKDLLKWWLNDSSNSEVLFSDNFNGDLSKWNFYSQNTSATYETTSSDGNPAPSLLTDDYLSYGAYSLSKQTFDYVGKTTAFSCDLKHGNAANADQRSATFTIYNNNSDPSGYICWLTIGGSTPVNPNTATCSVKYKDGAEEKEESSGTLSITNGDVWNTAIIKIRSDGKVEFHVQGNLIYTSTNNVTDDYDGNISIGCGSRKSLHDNFKVERQ